MEIKIREARPSDYPAIHGLLDEAGLSGKWLTKSLFTKLAKRNKGFYFVAEMEGKIVGNLFSSHDGGYYAYLYKVAVSPEFRKRGIATKLVKTAVKALNKAGVDWIFLHVRRTNKASIALFKSLGFRIKSSHLMANY